MLLTDEASARLTTALDRIKAEPWRWNQNWWVYEVTDSERDTYGLEHPPATEVCNTVMCLAGHLTLTEPTIVLRRRPSPFRYEYVLQDGKYVSVINLNKGELAFYSTITRTWVDAYGVAVDLLDIPTNLAYRLFYDSADETKYTFSNPDYFAGWVWDTIETWDADDDFDTQEL